MFSSIQLIILASCFGIIISRTTLLEKLKMLLFEKKVTLVTKAMDCPLCSSFWSGIILNAVFYNSIEDLIFNSFAGALLGYFIAKD